MSPARPAVPADASSSVHPDAAQPAACEVYVYFRSTPAQAGAVRAALARQSRLVASACSASVRVGLRLEPGGAPKDYLTWLEVYRLEPGPAAPAWPARGEAGVLDTGPLAGVLEAIERCARDSGLVGLAMQGRHREVFTLLPEPASDPGPPGPSGAAPRAR